MRYCSPPAPPSTAVAFVTTRSTSAASPPSAPRVQLSLIASSVGRVRFVSEPRVSLAPVARLVPAAHDPVGRETHEREGQDPEQRRRDDRAEELLREELCTVVVDQAPDAGVPLPEEEVADDRTDHGEARGDLQPD